MGTSFSGRSLGIAVSGGSSGLGRQPSPRSSSSLEACSMGASASSEKSWNYATSGGTGTPRNDCGAQIRCRVQDLVANSHIILGNRKFAVGVPTFPARGDASPISTAATEEEALARDTSAPDVATAEQPSRLTPRAGARTPRGGLGGRFAAAIGNARGAATTAAGVTPLALAQRGEQRGRSRSGSPTRASSAHGRETTRHLASYRRARSGGAGLNGASPGSPPSASRRPAPTTVATLATSPLPRLVAQTHPQVLVGAAYDELDVWADPGSHDVGVASAFDGDTLANEVRRLASARNRGQAWLKHALSQQVAIFRQELNAETHHGQVRARREGVLQERRESFEIALDGKRQTTEARFTKVDENRYELQVETRARQLAKDKEESIRQERIQQQRAREQQEAQELAALLQARRRDAYEEALRIATDRRCSSASRARAKTSKVEAILAERRNIWELRRTAIDEASDHVAALQKEIWQQRVSGKFDHDRLCAHC